ncbi:MAG: DUF2585 family protein [Planctomycetales bacterium]|nr:DUF2585 family protein [Planctomycetales bacterium]
MIRFSDPKHCPWWTILATVAAAIVVLRLEGQPWFCECNQLRVLIGDAYSSHTSQHLLDPYSLTHVQHGLVLFFLVGSLAHDWRWPWQLWLAIAIEAAWEIFENTPFVIDRYRTTTAALGYNGDSVLNSVGDILACTLGVLVARRLGWRKTCALFFTIELVLLVTIRDSLLLNVVMLLVPNEALIEWQQG